jgi:hypothetical protein
VDLVDSNGALLNSWTSSAGLLSGYLAPFQLQTPVRG